MDDIQTTKQETNNREYYILHQTKEAISALSFQIKNVLTLLEKIEEGYPDSRDIEEIKLSIGRSDKSVTQHLTEITPLVNNMITVLDKIPQLTSNYDIASEAEHRKHSIEMYDFINILKKSTYTESEINLLGKWMIEIVNIKLNIDFIKSHIDKLENLKLRIIYIVSTISFFITMIGWNWNKIIEIFKKLFGI